MNAPLKDKEKERITSAERGHFLPQLLPLSNAERKVCSLMAWSSGGMDPASLVSSLHETPMSSPVDRSLLGPR